MFRRLALVLSVSASLGLLSIPPLTVYAHPPIVVRIQREQQQRAVRIQAAAAKQQRDFERWKREWRRQEEQRQRALQPNRL